MKRNLFISTVAVLSALSAMFLYGVSPEKGFVQKQKNQVTKESQKNQQECVSPIAIYEDPARIPLRDFVLNELGDVKGKVVMDIGAGPGFFAFKIAEEAKQVYATELEEMYITYMREKVKKERVRNLEVVSARYDHGELKKIKADYALMVYVFHYLDNPRDFLDKLKAAIHPGGKVFIANAQLSPRIIKDYLEIAGFSDIQQAEFIYNASSCGPQEVQLISATRPSVGS